MRELRGWDVLERKISELRELRGRDVLDGRIFELSDLPRWVVLERGSGDGDGLHGLRGWDVREGGIFELHELRGWGLLDGVTGELLIRCHDVSGRNLCQGSQCVHALHGGDRRQPRNVLGRWGFGLHKLSLRDLRGVGGSGELYVL